MRSREGFRTVLPDNVGVFRVLDTDADGLPFSSELRLFDEEDDRSDFRRDGRESSGASARFTSSEAMVV